MRWAFFAGHVHAIRLNRPSCVGGRSPERPRHRGDRLARRAADPAGHRRQLVTDVSIGTLFGRGSGESLQMRFAGEGWGVVQPYEEASFQQSRG
ncbi:hypothetical protein XOC_0654 [Xanthomonas oryzae pv. oryzicola BLS256]|uniref:Uncharacterized protein n=1 Tax=Xanthomonas oryzae pv. oryzicola (strain BLS256) TaxID=383407 RepID=G7TBI3_XANOB|nr:hypothetical protein XOC_0654 [Xanthomonas oryzae pv. oryzicola BLS256]QEO99287.1 hypothetical protein XOCgx_4300 [Xanthomonas oryzae pv. oryzicola]